MVDVRKKAEEMGITILEEDSPSDVKGTAFKIGEKWYITVNPQDTEERKSFTIAHEIAEIMLYDDKELSNDDKHKIANFIAGEILMPKEEFKKDIYQNDLYQLKKIYSNCSYEAISRRMLNFMPQILTIFDNKKKYIRIASESIRFPQNLTKAELDVVEKCYELKSRYEKNEENLKIIGYFIDEGRGVERVILLTEILDL